ELHMQNHLSTHHLAIFLITLANYTSKKEIEREYGHVPSITAVQLRYRFDRLDKYFPNDARSQLPFLVQSSISIVGCLIQLFQGGRSPQVFSSYRLSSDLFLL